MKNRSGPPRWSRAFTLVEIMIAITILSMLLAAIYASWNAVVRGSKAGLVAAADSQRARMAINALQTALSGIEMFTENIRHYSFIADTSGDFAAVSFVSRLPESFPGGSLFGDQPLRRVTFSVEPGTNGQNQLMMYQSRMLFDEEPHFIILAHNVKLFTTEFWDMRLNDWSPEWLYTNQLPRLVRFSLGCVTENSRRSIRPDEVMTRVVALPALAVPVGYQAPRGPVVPGGPGRSP